jgi:hypothetical protein
VAGGESVAGRGEDNHADILVGNSRGEGVIHLLDHHAGLRVLVARAVDDDLGDRAMLFVEDCLIFHGYISATDRSARRFSTEGLAI